MEHPFIRNHHYNLIRKQAGLLQHTCSTVSDPKVVESVRLGAQSKVVEAFPEATAFQRRMLENIADLRTANDAEHYLRSLEPYLAPFDRVTDNQLKKLFPKNKKLKLPDLAAIDFRYVTYLGWTDIATNKMFLVYPLDGRIIGIEGKFTPANKKSVCFLCNRHEEVALFTAIAKTKPANASPDYYKALGNYLCVSSDACNRNVTDVDALEKFVRAVTG
ncbi:FusB/FusC family EF-G-binding protein [Paenibacillus flagellatus]|uniref:Elongation factor G-binding protein n=1 Tax=Paenibacillus flagellatus TaxID=2211139 RepID=A0A2V5JY83_9BACL|nr:FusB/FusC family EF-G-binding protein [Paenibacillus flagellatus]PYI51778.1 elongation factor G-binding protein [Paenibacillus flagellatus]